MIAAFDFYSAPRIAFGVGAAGKLPEMVAGFGRRALVVLAARTDASNRIIAALTAAGIASETYEQRGEPDTVSVDEACALARQAGCDVVVGLGGGSAIDTAKAVAALVANGGAALDYMEVVGAGKKITRPSLPWIAVPTTAGTGAEVTRNAVVSFHARQFKASIRSDLMLARVAVIDPELCVSCPPAVTAASGMDALCQCIEAYTSRSANPLSDAVALRGLRAGAPALRVAVSRPGEVEARAGMSLAALCSGLALTSAGLGAVHGIAAPLGAAIPVPHGVVCAALLAGVMRANIDEARLASRGDVLERYAEVGRIISGDAGISDQAAIDAGPRLASELACDLGIPRLRDFGLSPASVAPVVELALKSSSMKFNPLPLSADTLGAVLMAAI